MTATVWGVDSAVGEHRVVLKGSGTGTCMVYLAGGKPHDGLLSVRQLLLLLLDLPLQLAVLLQACHL